jgi:hypothetical protein
MPHFRKSLPFEYKDNESEDQSVRSSFISSSSFEDDIGESLPDGSAKQSATQTEFRSHEVTRNLHQNEYLLTYHTCGSYKDIRSMPCTAIQNIPDPLIFFPNESNLPSLSSFTDGLPGWNLPLSGLPGP